MCPYAKFLMESSIGPQSREKQTVMIQVTSGLQTTAKSILIYFILLRHTGNSPRLDRNAEVNEDVVDELYGMRVTVSPPLLHALEYGDIQTGHPTKLN